MGSLARVLCLFSRVCRLNCRIFVCALNNKSLSMRITNFLLFFWSEQVKRPQAEHQLDWTRQFPNDSDTCKITLNIIAFVCCEQQINFRHLDLIPIRVAKTAGREREGSGSKWEHRQWTGSEQSMQSAKDQFTNMSTYREWEQQAVGAGAGAVAGKASTERFRFAHITTQSSYMWYAGFIRMPSALTVSLSLCLPLWLWCLWLELRYGPSLLAPTCT